MIAFRREDIHRRSGRRQVAQCIKDGTEIRAIWEDVIACILEE